MPKYADLPKKDGKVEYRGRLWEVNKPVKSDRAGKKYMVLAKKGDEVKLIHFGASGYKHNYSEEAKKSYLARSAGIRGKDGKLTKDDKFSPNYWARKFLWPQNKEADGSTARKDSFAARVPELRLEGRSPAYVEGFKLSTQKSYAN